MTNEITIEVGSNDPIVVYTDDSEPIDVDSSFGSEITVTEGGFLPYDDTEVWEHIFAIEAQEPTWNAKMDHIDPLNNLEIEDILR